MFQLKTFQLGFLSCLLLLAVGCAGQQQAGYQRVQNIPVGKYKNPVELTTKSGDTLRGEQLFKDKNEVAIQLFGQEGSLTFTLDDVRSVEPLDVFSMVWVEPKQEVPSRWRLLSSALVPGSGQIWYRGADDWQGWTQLGTYVAALSVIIASLQSPSLEPESPAVRAAGIVGAGALFWSWGDALVTAFDEDEPAR